MRIRKNVKLFAGLCEKQICHLNQSMWDVIPCASSSLPSQSLLEYEGVDRVTKNGSLTVSSETIKTMALPEESNMALKGKRTVSADDDTPEEENQIRLKRTKAVLCCNRKDARGWNCKREVKEGQTMCDHHLSQSRSYNIQRNRKTIDSFTLTSLTKKPMAKKHHNQSVKKEGSSMANHNEYYYYSGFGPQWRKIREEKVTSNSMMEVRTINAANPQTGTSSSLIDNKDVDYIILDDDNDDDVERNMTVAERRE